LKVEDYGFNLQPSIFNLQSSIFNLSMPFSITSDDLPRMFVVVILAAVLGYLANLFTGGRVPFRWFGAVLTMLVGLLGAWVALEVVRPRIPFALPVEPMFDGVMLVTAGLGAFVFALLWCLLVSRFSRR
jgi:uncharacterized membrane protein YeaQ/YmgE (transglycosylase-associated protein family)